jgi:hypothetical protein
MRHRTTHTRSPRVTPGATLAYLTLTAILLGELIWLAVYVWWPL